MPTKRIKKPETLPIVAIEWTDAVYSHYDDGLADPCPMMTFGFLLENTKEHVKLAAEVWADGGKRHIMTIPKQRSGMNPKIHHIGRVKVPASLIKYRQLHV
jgi:hypothetical protein